MPTLSTHVSDEISDAISGALSEDGKVSSWIARACEQRLEREGKLPGSARSKRIAKLIDLAAALKDEELDRLTNDAARAAG
jgi:hypothetical protein